MSAKATFWAWEQDVSSVTQKAILLCIADCHNDDTGQCNPSAPYIAKKTKCNIKTVYKAIKELADSGFLSIDKKTNLSNSYKLHITTNSGTTKNGTPTNSGTTKNGKTIVPKTVPEPKRESKSNIYIDFDFSKWPEKPSSELWENFLMIRKSKKKPVTQIAVDRMGMEMVKLVNRGYSVNDCLSDAVENSWQGVQARFYPDKPLSIDEVYSFMADRGCTDRNQAIRFFNRNESTGWRIGSTPITDWKKAALVHLQNQMEYAR